MYLKQEKSMMLPEFLRNNTLDTYLIIINVHNSCFKEKSAKLSEKHLQSNK